jgi:hypothetical protein
MFHRTHHELEKQNKANHGWLVVVEAKGLVPMNERKKSKNTRSNTQQNIRDDVLQCIPVHELAKEEQGNK